MTTSRRARSTKLKRSFVVTFSTLAAGLTGCSEDERIEEYNPPFYQTGGFGGSGGSAHSGGSGAVGGSTGTGGQSPAMPQCPADLPPHGGECDEQRASGMCAYDHKPNPCDDELDYTRAVCEQGAWVVDVIVTTCNPPGISDGNTPDEDAGR